MSKRAVFFSIDALIASSIILVSVLVIYPMLSSSDRPMFIHSDLMYSMSSITVGEIENTYVQNLIAEGKINDTSKTVLEQIAEFYVFNKTIAEEMTNSIFADLDLDYNFGIWFKDELVASKNSSSYEGSKTISSSTQIISGIEEGQAVTAYSGRAFLRSGLKNDYFYFGGYVGEGNVSALIEYHGEIKNVTFEGALGKDFELYVNGVYQGVYQAANYLLTPAKYSFPIADFESGTNLVELVGENFNLAGGFIKVTYEPEVSYEPYKRYRFPGISGLINLYDSFYVPSSIEEMSIYLKMNSSKDVFLRLGNTVIFEGNTTGVQEINFNNEFLSSILDYSSIQGETVPLRLGLHNVSYVLGHYRQADVISVTDLSGSMNDCGVYDLDNPYCRYQYCTSFSWGICWSWSWTQCDYTGTCSSDECGTSAPRTRNYGIVYDCDKTLMDLAKDANKAFLDIVLGNEGNRAGLVGYRTSVNIADNHELSSDNSSLESKINSWVASGGTCICCGINSAIQEMVANSDSSNFRSMIVMSDGEANYDCNGNYGVASAKSSAIAKACEAYEDYGIRVYSIGFGDSADETTLQEIAICGNGSYYYSSVAELESIYEQISQEVIEASFYEQQLVVEEGELYTRLYPESYISFKYTEPPIPYGLITTAEKQFDSIYGVNFDVPSGSQIVDAKVTSYSGSRWTTDVFVNGFSIYNLTKYGSDYLDLGDPYMVNVPISYLMDSNELNLTVGLAPTNKSAGSIHNKIIYTLSSNVSAFSGLFGVASGCIWNIEFASGDFLEISVPSSYGGSEECYYNSTIGGGLVSNTHDAIQDSVLNLLKVLDYDNDGKVDILFDSGSLEISTSELSGIPYDWSTKVQVRSWR